MEPKFKIGDYVEITRRTDNTVDGVIDGVNTSYGVTVYNVLYNEYGLACKMFDVTEDRIKNLKS